MTRNWPYDVYPPEGYRVCLRCPVFIPITKSIPLCHGCAKERTLNLIPAVPDDFVVPDHLLGSVAQAAQVAMSQPGWGPPPNVTALAEHRGITIEEAARLTLAYTIEWYKAKWPEKEGTK